jgi:small subunit ribosomal protein S14
MATTAKIAKSLKPAKFSTRVHNRCKICGRPKAFMRHFGMCRLCFRDAAKKGYLPGVTKASW